MTTKYLKQLLKVFGIPITLALAISLDPDWSRANTDAPLFEVSESAEDQSSQCNPVYSLYDPKTSKHLFTTDEVERKALAATGWTDEGICFGSAMESEPPVYRFYSPKNKEHLYTASVKEVEALEKGGWNNEGIAFYSSTHDLALPVYRLLNPNTNLHHFTNDSKEVEALEKLGWKSEGKAFKVLDPYTFQESEEGILAFDSYDQPVSGVLRLRTGTYYFDPENGNHMTTGWKTLPLSALDIAPETAQYQYTHKEYQVPEMPEIEWVEEDDYEEDETTLWMYSDAYLEAFKDASLEVSPSSDGQEENEKLESLELIELAEEEGLFLVKGLEKPSDTTLSLPLESIILGSEEVVNPDRLIEVYFLEDGRMAKGETALEDGVHFFHKTSGEHLKSEWVRYGNPAKTCYFDENGLQLTGKKEVNGRTFIFNETSGAMSLDLDSLLNQATSYIQAHKNAGETYSFGLRIVENGQSAFWNNQSQQSASVMKLFVMGAIYENYDKACEYAGKSVIDSNLHSMITVSSNEAWTFLVSVLGQGNYAKGVEVLDAWNEKHGYTQTRMEGVPYGNMTSVKDCSKILEDIEKGKLKNSAAMKDLIQRQAIAGRLRRGLPQNVAAGNKPGWLSNTENDTVIVWTEKGSYTISLLSTDLRSTSNAQAIMREVSAMCYAWMMENLNCISPIQQ